MKEQNNATFCVRLKEPLELRRNILETLRELLELLQRFEKFKHVRHAKVEKMRKLVTLMKEANKLIGNLKLKLPQTNLKGIVLKELPARTQQPHDKKKNKGKSVEEKHERVPKREMTEIDKLESELKAIESKLKSLS